MAVIPDGRHDVLIVDAETDEQGVVHFELAITTGPHKGEVVRIAGSGGGASGAGKDPIDLLGLPATLIVEEGRPRLVMD